MSIESLKSLFDVGAVVLLFLTFAFGVGVLVTGNIINKRQEAQLRKFDSDLTLAKTELAKQQERAANAERDAADAKKTAQGFQLDIANANERAAEANAVAAKANESAEKERLARVELQDKVAWRSLTSRQKEDFAKHLSAFAGQFGYCSFLSSDSEAFSFASEIASALRVAKWRVVPPNPGMIVLKETPQFNTDSPVVSNYFGVEVSNTNDKTAAAAAHALVDELTRLGFDATHSDIQQKTPYSAVSIVVQHRPLGAQGEANIRNKNAD